MAKINEIDITSLTFQEGSAPSTPASTKWKIYTKTDGLYFIDDAGTETGPLGAGGAGSSQLTLLDTQTVSGSAAAIDHSSIATGYDELLIVARIRSGGNTTQGDEFQVRCGASTVDTAAASYSYGRILDAGSNAGNSAASGSATFMYLGNLPSASHATDDFAHCIIRVYDYDNASRDTIFEAWNTYALQDGSIYRTTHAVGGHRVGGAIDIISMGGGATVSGTAGICAVGSTSRLFGRTYPT